MCGCLTATPTATCKHLRRTLTRDYHPRTLQLLHRGPSEKARGLCAQFADRVGASLLLQPDTPHLRAHIHRRLLQLHSGPGTHLRHRATEATHQDRKQNYSRKCWALSLDIRGYFMHIDRRILNDIATGTLRRMATHRTDAGNGQTWGDVVDMDFLCWLTEKIVMIDPEDIVQG